MTDTTDRSLLAHLFVVAMVGVLVLSPVASVFGPVGTASASDGIHYVTDSGFEIEDTSGGSARPTFSDDNTLDLPGITLSSSGSAFVTLEQRTGTYTKLSGIDENPDITVNPDDKQTVVIKSGLNSLDFADVDYASSGTDLEYSAGSTVSLTIKEAGLIKGTRVVATDASTGNRLTTALVDNNGVVRFTDLPSGTKSIDLIKEVSATPPPSDTVPPSIQQFNLTNPTGKDLNVSVDSFESLETISVSINGPESTTLSTSAFTEVDTQYGVSSYIATYESSNDGIYTATLETAADQAGNDGASSQTAQVTVDSSGPSISSLRMTNSSGENLTINFDSDEQLPTINATISGAESASLSAADFTETIDNDGSYTYEATYAASTDGTYTLTLTAVDDTGNDATDSTSVTIGDTTAPSVSNVTLDESSGNMTVSFDTDEQLGTNTGAIAASVTGPAGKNYAFDRPDFTESGSGPYTYSLSATQAYDDGNGTYSLSIDDALDAAGNNGGNDGTGTSLTGSHTVSCGGDNAVYDPGDPAAGYDKNTDCRIQIGELGDAAADYAQGSISIGTLGDVAADYAQSGSTTTARHERSQSQDGEPREVRSLRDRWGSIVLS